MIIFLRFYTDPGAQNSHLLGGPGSDSGGENHQKIDFWKKGAPKDVPGTEFCQNTPFLHFCPLKTRKKRQKNRFCMQRTKIHMFLYKKSVILDIKISAQGYWIWAFP